MKTLANYNAAPAPEKFRAVDLCELAEIAAELDAAGAAGDTVADRDAEIASLAIAAQALGATIFVARDEDGYFFASDSDFFAATPE